MLQQVEIPPPSSLSNLESVLRRRGHRIKKTGDISRILYPEESWLDVVSRHGHIQFAQLFSPEFISAYLDLFAKRSFRKVAKSLVDAYPHSVSKTDLASFCGPSLQGYLEVLHRYLLIEQDNETAKLTRKIENLGPSLEHYVSDLLVREYHGSSKWGVILQDLPVKGGDYDVLAWLDPSLLYVECKTSDPRNITNTQVRHFMQRTVELAPDLAILLVDTDDSLPIFVRDKVEPVIEAALVDRSDLPIDRKDQSLPNAVSEGVYQVFTYPAVYVTGPNPSIDRQLSRCLKHYYAHVRNRAFYDSKTDFTR